MNEIYYSNSLICVVPQIIVQKCQGTLILNTPFSTEELLQSIQAIERWQHNKTVIRALGSRCTWLPNGKNEHRNQRCWSAARACKQGTSTLQWFTISLQRIAGSRQNQKHQNTTNPERGIQKIMHCTKETTD